MRQTGQQRSTHHGSGQTLRIAYIHTQRPHPPREKTTQWRRIDLRQILGTRAITFSEINGLVGETVSCFELNQTLNIRRQVRIFRTGAVSVNGQGIDCLGTTGLAELIQPALPITAGIIRIRGKDHRVGIDRFNLVVKNLHSLGADPRRIGIAAGVGFIDRLPDRLVGQRWQRLVQFITVGLPKRIGHRCFLETDPRQAVIDDTGDVHEIQRCQLINQRRVLRWEKAQ